MKDVKKEIKKMAKKDVKKTNELNVKLSYEKNGKFENLTIETPKGVKIPVKLAFYNRKLLFKVLCEIDGK